MILGQSAGLAASITADNEIPIQDIQYSDLRTELIKPGRYLKFHQTGWKLLQPTINSAI